MRKQKFDVTGMTCSACSSHVEKSVRKLEGMEQVTVNLLTNSMQVEYDENKLDMQQIINAVDRAGYGAREAVSHGASAQDGGTAGGSAVQAGGAFGGAAAQGHTGSGRNSVAGDAGRLERAMKWRLGVSVLFWLPLMYVAMYHMFYEWFGLPVPAFIHHVFHGPENAVTFAFTQLLLTLPILYVNQNYFRGGFRSLFHGSPNMDTLIAIGAGAAAAYGVAAIFRIGYGLGHGDLALVERWSMDIYFESAGTILTLITVGKYLESRSKGKTSEAITRLLDLSPKTALVEREGVEMEIPTEQVAKGDIFLVKPGSLVPVDGVIVSGTSSVDESAITGESIPVEKQAGDKIVSATMNKAGFLRCQATGVGEDTTLSQIIRLVEEASAGKAPIARLADRIAGVFVPVVICIALLAMAVWLLAGAGFEFAMSTAIAVLVISCPCALGLATPVAIMVGTGVGAGRGILIKSGEALQRAREIDTVVMDKTGTVTQGSPRVQRIVALTGEQGGEVPAPDGQQGREEEPTSGGQRRSEEELLALAASLEKGSEHPLAEAIVQAAQERGLLLREISEFQAAFGKGIRGRTADGALYYVGKEGYLTESGVQVSRAAVLEAEKLAVQGQTPIFLADENHALAVLGVADSVKPTGRQAVAQLKGMGIDTVMLTGDNQVTAEAVGAQLDIPQVIAQVLPEEKAAVIQKLQREGRRVAMVGDGINDAPALAAADVGIAIGAGTDVAVESADVILMKNDLTDVAAVVRLSRAVIRNIKENLFWAFFYNCIGIPVAAGLFYPLWGFKLNPMFGAAAMSLSSIFVVSNALRLRFLFRREDKAEETAEQERTEREVRQKQSGQQDKEVRQKRSGQQDKAVRQDDIINSREEERSSVMTKTISIEGMACAHCSASVQKALEAVAGVESVQVSLEAKNAVVTLKETVADDILRAAVTEAGYEVTAVS